MPKRENPPTRALLALADAVTPRKYLGDLIIDDERIPYGITWGPVHAYALERLRELPHWWETIATAAAAQQSGALA